MSGIGNLFEVLSTAYGRKNPVRDLFYRCFHKVISTNLVRKGNAMHQQIAVLDSPQFENITDDEKNAIISLADKTLNNTFNYLGSGDCKLDPINWSQDFKSGYVWPVGRYYKKYRQVDLSNNADVKVPRELSRSHFLLHLALAYQFTKDEKYAKKAYDLMEDWIDNNPLMYSINWGCAMDVAIRAVNWIWALPLLEQYNVSEEMCRKIKGSLYQHGWFIYRNLEGSIFGYNNNHYFSDIVGLLHIGLLFKNSKEGNKWFEYASKEFFREFRLQILPCGMLYEGSAHYDRLVLELVIPSIVILERNGYVIPPDIYSRYESMFGFVKDVLMPDGSFPIIADQDNGRCLPWGANDNNDMRYLMSLGSLLFNRSDFKLYGNGYNIYCAIFCDNDVPKKFSETDISGKKSQSCFIKDAGLVVMRKDNDYLIFNADNQGMYRDSGTSISHTHSDWFSFVLAVKGVSFFVDPGTYTYSADAKMRNLFRSTAMHNTITIDEKSQEEINATTLWNMERRGKVFVENWHSSSEHDVIRCRHTGYERLESPAYHTRSILYDKMNRVWTLTDVIESNHSHYITSHFHLDSDVNISKSQNGYVLDKNDVSIEISFNSQHQFDLCINDTYISKSYGHIVASKEIVCSAEADKIEIIVTIKLL